MDEQPKKRYFENIEEYNRLYNRVCRYFARQGFPLEDCLDLTQETYRQVTSGLDKFRGDAQFATWVLAIAENVYKKRIRQKKTHKRTGEEVSIDHLPPDKLSPSDSPWPGNALRPGPVESGDQLKKVLTTEKLELVRKCMQTLPPQMRRCIMLYSLQGRKYREIAELLQLSINTVKAQINEARSRLKACLGDLYDPRRGARERNH